MISNTLKFVRYVIFIFINNPILIISLIASIMLTTYSCSKIYITEYSSQLILMNILIVATLFFNPISLISLLVLCEHKDDNKFKDFEKEIKDDKYRSI